jgi:hypothetical protein
MRVLMPIRCERFQPSRFSPPSKKLQLWPDVYPEHVMPTASSAPVRTLRSMRLKSRLRDSRASSGRLSSSETRLFLKKAPNSRPANHFALFAVAPMKSAR